MLMIDIFVSIRLEPVPYLSSYWLRHHVITLKSCDFKETLQLSLNEGHGQ